MATPGTTCARDFWPGTFDAAFDDTRAGLMAFDRTVTEDGRFDEIVLWFEHDLFDQLLLIRTLDLLVRLKPDPTYRDVSQICRGPALAGPTSH